MALISFLFFQRHLKHFSYFPLFDVDHLKIANCSNLTIVFYPLGNFGQTLCHEDLILTRKSHSCSGIAFIQGESAGGSKLIEQTLIYCSSPTQIACTGLVYSTAREGQDGRLCDISSNSCVKLWFMDLVRSLFQV